MQKTVFSAQIIFVLLVISLISFMTAINAILLVIQTLDITSSLIAMDKGYARVIYFKKKKNKKKFWFYIELN